MLAIPHLVPEESSAENPESLLASLLGESQEDTLPVAYLLPPERSEFELECEHTELVDLFNDLDTNAEVICNTSTLSEIDDVLHWVERSPSLPKPFPPPPPPPFQNEEPIFQDIFSLDTELTKLLEVNKDCHEVPSLSTSQIQFSPATEMPSALKERASKEAQSLLKCEGKARKPKKSVPALLKTEAYVDKRRRNNLSAAMCRSNEREARAAKTCRHKKAKERNALLRQKIAELENIANDLQAVKSRIQPSTTIRTH